MLGIILAVMSLAVAFAQTPTPMPGQFIPIPPKCESGMSPKYKYDTQNKMFKWVCVKK